MERIAIAAMLVLVVLGHDGSETESLGLAQHQTGDRHVLDTESDLMKGSISTRYEIRNTSTPHRRRGRSHSHF